MLRALAAASLMAALGRSPAAAATCRREGRTCGGKRGRCCNPLACCAGRCRDLRSDRRFCGACDTPCPAGSAATCHSRRCLCPDGRPPCGEQCCPANCSCSPDGNACLCSI